MKYPTQRYGNIHEFAYHAMGIPVRDLAKRLKRSERSIRNWLSGAEKLPWWVPEILRLQRLEHEQRMYQMNIQPLRAKLGLVSKTATLYEFPCKELLPSEPVLLHHNAPPENYKLQM